MARHPSLIMMLAVAAFLTVFYLMSGGKTGVATPNTFAATDPKSSEGAASATDFGAIPKDVLLGEAIAPKLENATAKYVDCAICAGSSQQPPLLSAGMS
jgi:hypothetical protein